MFKTLFKPRGGQTLETARIGIKGMTCKNCEATVKKALLTKNGVKEVEIDRAAGVATVKFDSLLTNLAALHEVILRKGYFPGPVAEQAAGRGQ
jgi:copper chaperone CopZ